jgi:hypothetical protein
MRGIVSSHFKRKEERSDTLGERERDDVYIEKKKVNIIQHLEENK